MGENWSKKSYKIWRYDNWQADENICKLRL